MASPGPRGRGGRRRGRGRRRAGTSRRARRGGGDGGGGPRRRGTCRVHRADRLDRVGGDVGAPWPPACAGRRALASGIRRRSRPRSRCPRAGRSRRGGPSAAPVAAEPVDASSAPARAVASSSPATGRSLRRGLPRTPGGEPWPPAGFAPAVVEEIVDETALPEQTIEVAVASGSGAPASVDVSTPLPFPRTVWQGAAAAACKRISVRA
ncbi:hypothetical protein [Microbacterium sp. NIBRBAC000506063]|uniref:hypothetical protein n=1 Tax=Microbacterium sp. NIBRBAC000506063 TaxID=2734618 RepID=UPI001CB7545A|nr:hypothetical protein [Microbacterium sp. NIBRBAC000506063]